MTTPPTESGPAPALPSPVAAVALPARADRFFAWTSGLGIVRSDGWLGGVAAGIAARLRIDPLIVRGILVVVALFGFPALFLYGLAWALLPDLDGRIPLQDALHGRMTPGMVGAAAATLLGLAPSPLVLILAPSVFVVLPTWPLATVLACVAALIVVFLAVVIVRAAFSAPRAPAPAATPDARTASAASTAPGESAASSGSGPDAAVADDGGADATGADLVALASAPSPELTPPAEPAEPAAPAANAPEDEYAAWRAQHAAWKEQDDAWRRQQQDATRAARDQARAERQAQAAAFSAEAAERRRLRRATSPRTPFAFVATVVGVAVVAGALVGLTGAGSLAGARGLFVAALVGAVGMAVAGLARRRSGFLAFVTMLLLVGGVAATAAPAMAALHLGSYGISNDAAGPEWSADAPFVQPWGDVYVSLRPVPTGTSTRPIHIEKETGGTFVSIDPGVTVVFDITAPAWVAGFQSSDGEYTALSEAEGVTTHTTDDGRVRLQGTLVGQVPEGETATIQKLVIDQRSGYISIQQYSTTEVTR